MASVSAISLYANSCTSARRTTSRNSAGITSKARCSGTFEFTRFNCSTQDQVFSPRSGSALYYEQAVAMGFYSPRLVLKLLLQAFDWSAGHPQDPAVLLILHKRNGSQIRTLPCP